MEKVVQKRSLKDFRDRESPWKSRSYLERLCALTEICKTQHNDGTIESGFPRVYRITRKARG
jgi:hypothetical protein